MLPGKIAEALRLAHDEGGHFSPRLTLVQLNRRMYWPGMAHDMALYCLGCLECARFGLAKPKAPLLPITISRPFQVVMGDFMGPFPETKDGCRHFFAIIEVFSRFGWAIPTKDRSAKSGLQAVDLWTAGVGIMPTAFYSDPGSSFVSSEYEKGMPQKGIHVISAPATSHRSMGLVEVFKKLDRPFMRHEVRNFAWEILS